MLYSIAYEKKFQLNPSWSPWKNIIFLKTHMTSFQKSIAVVLNGMVRLFSNMAILLLEFLRVEIWQLFRMPSIPWNGRMALIEALHMLEEKWNTLYLSLAINLECILSSIKHFEDLTGRWTVNSNYNLWVIILWHIMSWALSVAGCPV